MWRLLPILLICALAVGCGGRGLPSATGDPPTSTPIATSGSNPAPAPPSSSSATPTEIPVAAGQNVTGADITVAPPASATPPNAQDLGVNPVAGLGMAVNTGGSIHRGSTARILLFGPGLTGNMSVIIGGPHDLKLGGLQAVSATDNTPGVAFTVTAAGNAALGSRTVYLKSSNGDMTSFTGGLEVVP